MPKRPWKDLILVNKIPKEGEKMKRIDMTGNKYGHLLVTKMMFGCGQSGKTMCECVCDCGNKVIMNAYSLRKEYAYPHHCGCMKAKYLSNQFDKMRVNLVGKRFGSLTVTRMIYERNKQTLVECICDCGNTTVTKAVYLNNGDTKSCGCLQPIATSNANTKDFSGVVSDYGVEIVERDSQTDRGVWLWKCRCGECGNIFVALPAKILSGHTTSCGCIRRSSGEKLIATYLKSSGIAYESEKRFSDCADIRSLPFDFYLPEYNIAIEYQGQQHYTPSEWFGGVTEYEKRIMHDRIKEMYCNDRNIKLVYIKYDETPEEVKQKITSIIYPERLSCSGR